MSYQVLARKWRPGNFHEMVGQEHVLRALINALDNDRLHHAYLFTGTRGVGKTTVARILARCLNCEVGVSSQPCGTCSSCMEISEGRSVDLLEVDAASRTKVEDTRELLENVQYAPTSSRYKVYLIDEVHMLSSHSFNALLKTLEEPPPHVKFLLATTDPQKLPATVLSRCLQFNLKNMTPEIIVSHLGTILEKEAISFEEPALWLLGRAAAGSMRDALSLTDQAIAFGSGKVIEDDVRAMLGSVDLSFVYDLLGATGRGEPADLLDVIARMNEHGADFAAGLDELLSLIHRVATAQVVPDAIDNRWGDADKVAALAKSLTAEDVQLYYQVALNGKRDLELAPEPRAGFEMIMLRMLAFRPAAVIDESLSPEDLQAAPVADAALEVGQPTKKSVEQAGSVLDAGAASQRGVEPTPASAPTTQPEQAPPTEQTAHTKPATVTLPAQQEAAAARSAGEFSLDSLTASQWWRLLEELGLAGIVYSIAAHCELASYTPGRFAFVLDERNASLFNESHSDKLRMALENYFGQPVTVEITTSVPGSETPAMRLERLKQERQQEAVSAIEGDPQLQALIARFDGELDRASIHPTDKQ